jgi:hypothetical protein
MSVPALTRRNSLQTQAEAKCQKFSNVPPAKRIKSVFQAPLAFATNHGKSAYGFVGGKISITACRQV